MSLNFPDSVDAAAVKHAQTIIAKIADHDKLFALVSGGHDSLTAMHIVSQSSAELDGIVFIDTGIGVPETKDFVEDRAAELGIPFHCVGEEYRRKSESYPELVQKFGMPGPPLHKIMYLSLKENPLKRFLYEFSDDIGLISGVSRHESARRMENVPASGVGTFLGYPVYSPIVNFRGIDTRNYRRDLGLPMNPVVEKLEMSAECLCGAFASHGERRMIKLFYPDVNRHLLCLEAKAVAASGLEDGPDSEYTEWGHGRLADHERTAKADDNQMLLCQSCQQACDG